MMYFIGQRLCFILFFIVFLIVNFHCFVATKSVNGTKFKDVTVLGTKFLKQVELEARELSRVSNQAEWDYQTNLNAANLDASVRSALELTQFLRIASYNASKLSSPDLPHDLSRQIMLIGKTASPSSMKEQRQINELQGNMTALYSKGRVCIPNLVANKCRYLELDPGLYNYMTKTRDYKALRHAWKEWRDVVGRPMRPLYEQFVKLINIGAREHGWGDYGNYWRSEYEMGNDLLPMLRKLWQNVKPLYQELHAYVRYKLSKEYSQVSLNEPIEAHLLGNMWAQDWVGIFDLVKPFRKVPSLDVTKNLIKQQYTVEKMFKLAQSFYVSIGLDPLPPSFWNLSLLVKPNKREVVCHPSAWDIDKGDVRIKMCTKINQDDLFVMHHEMGHLEYDLAYKDLPFAYRAGANPGFHEAIGDTIALSVESPDHLKSVGLLYAVGESEESTINFLMKQALRQVAGLPFTYLVDRWRWQVFAGSISASDYNGAWWKLRNLYQGIRPPIPRTEKDFDPGAKYHIGANSAYMSYFVSLILQFQLHKSLCSIAKHQGPLHKCSIYKSTEAGAKLKKMLAAGRSRPWPQILHELTDQRELRADAILEYFSPLQSWLFRYRQRHGYPLGWRKAQRTSQNGTASGIRKSSPFVNLSSPATLVSTNSSIISSNNTTNNTKSGISDVSFQNAKMKTDAINLKKPDLIAALAAMQPSSRHTPEENLKSGESLLDAKSAIIGAKPMFVPNKIKDQINLNRGK